ncbi:hypothetical protein ENKNEFLB_02718 [Nocardioides aquaticus]|uniref:Cellulose synthase n=1 Tax=Nocardioides aquaticus TaxID=160826 RepID=A0ABX8EIH3_9ACTN|nr:hypothetical protein [Nocardioides aquaticus]QVT80323.1 hypothetical protein ENKNEFLB_02718 [Nocardioides aquaticus]
MDNATWLALTVTLTLVGAVATWVAYRRRGLPAAMLAAGVTVLVPAAYLTRTLRMLTEVADAVAGWATSMVLSPTVWTGIVLAGIGALLIAGSRALAARGVGARRRGVPLGATAPTGAAAAPAGRERPQVRAGRKAEPAAAEDDDLADIEALLKRRGIS